MKFNAFFFSLMTMSIVYSNIVIAEDLYHFADKNPFDEDVSINKLIVYTCSRSGFFNPLACQEDISSCYKKYQFPKTVTVEVKLDVMNECGMRYVRH